MMRPYISADHIIEALQILNVQGFSPKGILDVGAYEGEFARMATSIFYKSPILMIEAQPTKEDALKAVARKYPGLIEFRIALLGDESRDQVPFYQLESGSSIYPEQTTVSRELIHLPMRTLDEIVEEMPADRIFDLLKLDVQGAELDILRGGQRTVTKIEVMIVELAVHEYNKSAPLIYDVMSKLDNYGFVLFDIFPVIRNPQGVLLAIDGVFVRKGSSLRPSPPYF
jgi:FkbM family methyltransferase